MRSPLSRSLLASFLLLFFPACGDDSGGNGDVADGPPTEQPDAPDLPDAAPTIDAGPTADAREDFTGLDQPCCDPTGTCEGGMVCLVLTGLRVQSCGPDPATDGGAEPADAGTEGGICRPTCVPGAAIDCPFPSQCRMFTGDIGGVCLPAVGDDAACGPGIRCADGYLCVATGAGSMDHFCREICTSATDCDASETCTTVTSMQMACLPN